MSKRSLFFIFFAVLFLTIFLIVKLVNAQGGLLFLSFKPGYLWQVKRKEKNDFRAEVAEFTNEKNKIIFVLFPKLKETIMSVGFGIDEPLYYGEWRSIGKWHVLKIYIDKDTWEKHSSLERADRLSGFIRLSILEGWKLKLFGENKKYSDFFNSPGPNIKVVKYLPFK